MIRYVFLAPTTNEIFGEIGIFASATRQIDALRPFFFSGWCGLSSVNEEGVWFIHTCGNQQTSMAKNGTGIDDRSPTSMASMRLGILIATVEIAIFLEATVDSDLGLPTKCVIPIQSIEMRISVISENLVLFA